MSREDASQRTTRNTGSAISPFFSIAVELPLMRTAITDATKKVVLPSFRTLLESLSSPSTLKDRLPESPRFANSPTFSSSSCPSPSLSSSAASEDSPESSGTPITDADSGELPTDEDENIEQTTTKQVAQWIEEYHPTDFEDVPDESSEIDLHDLNYRYDERAASPPIETTGDVESPVDIEMEDATILPENLFPGGRFQSYGSFRVDKPIPSSVTAIQRPSEAPREVRDTVHVEASALALPVNLTKGALTITSNSVQNGHSQRPPRRAIKPRPALNVDQNSAPIANPVPTDTLPPTTFPREQPPRVLGPNQFQVDTPTLPGSFQVDHYQRVAAAAAPSWQHIMPTEPQSAWGVHQYNAMAPNSAPVYPFSPTVLPGGPPPHMPDFSQFYPAPTMLPGPFQDVRPQARTAGTAPRWRNYMPLEPPSDAAIAGFNATRAVAAPFSTMLLPDGRSAQDAPDSDQFHLFRNTAFNNWQEYDPLGPVGPRKRGRPRGSKRQQSSEAQPAAKKKHLDEQVLTSSSSKQPDSADKTIEKLPTAEGENSAVAGVERDQVISEAGEVDAPLTAGTARAEFLAGSPWNAITQPPEAFNDQPKAGPS